LLLGIKNFNMAKSLKKADNSEIMKPPLSYTILGIFPYDGTVVYSIEAKPLISTILLNDLRTLYRKVIPSEVKLLETSRFNSLIRLATVCPNHYRNIFEKEAKVLNIDLLKTRYPEEFNFINQTALNIITVEEYKTKYISIIDRLNSAVRALVDINEKISIYNSEKINIPQNTYELIIRSVIKLEKSKHGKQKSGKENAVPVENENENKPQIPKFIWNKSFEQLKSLFKDLFGTYIDRVNFDSLRQHFQIKGDPPSYTPTEEFKKINWKAELRGLAFFIYKLKSLGFISNKGIGIHKLTVMHFTVFQKETTPHRLGSSLSEIKKLDKDIGLQESYIILVDMIKKKQKR
jgi:hypothetical protein